MQLCRTIQKSSDDSESHFAIDKGIDFDTVSDEFE